MFKWSNLFTKHKFGAAPSKSLVTSGSAKGCASLQETLEASEVWCWRIVFPLWKLHEFTSFIVFLVSILVLSSGGIDIVLVLWLKSLEPAAGEENFISIKLVMIFWCIHYGWKLIRWWFSISIADANDIELNHVARASDNERDGRDYQQKYKKFHIKKLNRDYWN